MDQNLCTPAVVYGAIALVILIVGIIIRMTRGYNFYIMDVLMHLVSIIVCVLILAVICKVSTTISWVIVAIFILGILSMFTRFIAGESVDFRY